MTSPPDTRPHLGVVIPAFNEEARIGPTLERLAAYLRARPWTAEILVVDDGSTDATRARAEEALRDVPRSRVLGRAENRGKGFSVREGVLASEGAHILFTDADLSTPIEELEKFWPPIQAGRDIVIGSRALPGSDIRVRQTRLRRGMGKVFNLLVRLFLLRGIPDTQCGFKLFRREAARAVFAPLATTGFAFDVEVLLRARRMGLRIAQVPVVWRNSPPSKVRLIGSSARMLAELLMIYFMTRREKGTT
ncbi:MAG: glycosyltransferase family 2 protein [Candidatus Aminicenantes bacterium]|nr:glycosyltransferase family 2 protein [Candidatus Aminicenantes bacterium]